MSQSVGVDSLVPGMVSQESTSQGQPHFVIVNYPNEVKTTAGQKFYICVDVKNDGNADGTVMVQLYNEKNEMVDSREVNIPAGNTVKSICVSDTRSDPGTYNYTVVAYNEETGNKDDTKQVTVTVSPQTATTVQTSGSGSNALILLGLLLLFLWLLSRR